MRRRLTITITEGVYDGLHQKMGRGEISHFIESLARPHVVDDDDAVADYRAMAADVEREREAAEWIESHAAEGLN
jgi:hypothetical protein